MEVRGANHKELLNEINEQAFEEGSIKTKMELRGANHKELLNEINEQAFEEGERINRLETTINGNNTSLRTSEFENVFKDLEKRLSSKRTKDHQEVTNDFHRLHTYYYQYINAVMQQLETVKMDENNDKHCGPLEREEKNKTSINCIQRRNSENIGHYDTSMSLNHSCEFKIENGDTDHTLPIMNCPERLFKIIFVGDSGVGKTSFIHRFCNDKFLSTFHATVGIDYRVKTFVVKGQLIALQLWDTAEQERYRSISRQYFRKTDGVIFMYDVTSELSFRNICNWIASVKENSDNRLVSVLVGNKRDLFQKEGLEITTETGEELAKKHESLFYETSCKTGQGIFDVMNQMACALQLIEDQEIERIREIYSSKKQNKCC